MSYVALGNRHLPLFLAVLAGAVMLPSLKYRWFWDDLIIRARMLEPPQYRQWLNRTGLPPLKSGGLSTTLSEMYAFAGRQGDPNMIVETGYLPWWTYPEGRASFWRPLTSFTVWLDYQMFPNCGALQHLHNIAWFAAAVALVTCLYRRLIRPVWVAGLAALIYAIDGSHYFPVVFLSHRNSLLALFFGALALLMHDRWRRKNWIPGMNLSILFLGMSLLSAEAGLATLIYLAAYALFLDRGRRLHRLLSLVPSIMVVGIWRQFYCALGYRTHSNGLYIDPGQEPLRFAGLVMERAPLLLFGQFGWQPSDIYNSLSSSARLLMLIVALSFVTFVLVMFLPLITKDRVARFWLAGMLFALVPICATMPSNRNLIFASIGGTGLVAQFIGGLFTGESWLPKWRLWRVSAWLLCAVFLVTHLIGPSISKAILPGYFAGRIMAVNALMEVGSPPGSENQGLVIVNAPNPCSFIAMPAYYCLNDRPLPRYVRILAGAFSPLEIIRTESNAIVVRATSGSLLSCDPNQSVRKHWAYHFEDFNRCFRDKSKPLRIGYQGELSQMSIVVKCIDSDGQPTEALFRFTTSPDDKSLRWLWWDWQTKRYYPFSVPALGETAYLPGPFDKSRFKIPMEADMQKDKPPNYE